MRRAIPPLPLKTVVMFVCIRRQNNVCDLKEELKVLIDAVDHLGCKGEVKVAVQMDQRIPNSVDRCFRQELSFI